VIVPADMSALVGTIAGVGALAKEAFGNNAARRPGGSVPNTQ